MSLDMHALRERFERTAVAAGASRASVVVFERLVARYSEAHRRYHTLAHIDACLGWLDWFRGSAERPELVELALWFHDAVYDPRASDNESQSAQLARDQLAGLGVGRSALEVVALHIAATREHLSTDVDSCLVVDVDLAILGAKDADFARFETQIRDEYGHVSDSLYALGRARVLHGFLARSAIYQLPQIRDELELRARANLERTVAAL